MASSPEVTNPVYKPKQTETRIHTINQLAIKSIIFKSSSTLKSIPSISLNIQSRQKNILDNNVANVYKAFTIC